MKKRYWFLLVILLIVGTYMAGPRASFPKVAPETPSVPMDIVDLEPFIQKREAGIDNLKPNNQARIIWADSVRKTEWAVVYLHGFSASPMEGDPTHREFAARYGCNL
ncbi:MAG: alpha/beta hydrolase, partial [Bacteroidota bacterium]